MNHLRILDFLEQEIGNRERHSISLDGFRSAAVLVPLLFSDHGWELLFTVRSKQLSNHAGQISFPGGKVDQGESLEHAAAREMQEEIGIRPKSIIGKLDDHPSPARFVVTPCVGLVHWPQTPVLNPSEVDAVFTVPVAELAKINPRVENRTIEQIQRKIYYYDYGEHVIWGLTANIVKNLIDVIGMLDE